MKFEIKNRFTGAVQYTCELTAEMAGREYSVQLGFAVRSAVAARAYLAGANLTGANLTGANLAYANLTDAYLTGADLTGANLTDANGTKLTLVGRRPVLTVGPLGSRFAQLAVFLTNAGVYVRAGCFWNTLDAFREAVASTHPTGAHAEEYAAAIALIEVYARLWTPATEAKTEAA